MEFTKSLIKGKLIKRYKRFFVDVKLDKEIVTAHCPNTGSMKGLLEEGIHHYLYLTVLSLTLYLGNELLQFLCLT